MVKIEINKKVISRIALLILLAGFAGFQINDQGINPEKIKNLVISDKQIIDIQTFPEEQVMDILIDQETNRYLVYENCTIKANQDYRIDRINYNIYDAENNTLCLIKEIRKRE